MDKQRIAFRLEYEGTAYCGFQLQPDQPTIQQMLEDALLNLFQKSVRITGSGRTDSGVHARGQVVHADIPGKIPENKVAKALNTYLPRDIRITALSFVNDGFHARYDAVSRVYKYTIYRGITALERQFSWQIYQALNVPAMKECLKMIKGEHDFTSFCLSQTETENRVCTVQDAEWLEDGARLIFRIQANRFLHSMVRALTGTMVDVGKRRFDVLDFKEILKKCQHGAGAFTAPPQGLVLEEVIYNPQITWQWSGESV
jgi:tRNA pseudouridine38-40 synthase